MSLKPISINNKKNSNNSSGVITPKNEKSLEHYFKEITKCNQNILTREEEVELFEKVKNGDESAKNKIITSNLKFVISVAKKYMNQGLPFEDLINEGNIGLIKAVDKFDNTKNIKFISYAVWWIRQSILQALSDKGKSIRVPVNKRDSLIRINKMISKMENMLERKPTMDEIIEAAADHNVKNTQNEINQEDIVNIMTSEVLETSFDEPINNKSEESYTLLETIPSPTIGVISRLEHIDREITNLLSNLSKKEANIIKLSFGILKQERHNLDEISDMYMISPERVRQIKETALRKLRDNPRVDILFDYMND